MSITKTDRGIRVSPAVLGRIADTLMLDADQRSSMFGLAVPELGSATKLQAQSNAVLEAHAWLRRFRQRLWSATTEGEALALVREHCLSEFDPDAMATAVRDDSVWNSVETGSTNACRRWDSLYSLNADATNPKSARTS